MAVNLPAARARLERLAAPAPIAAVAQEHDGAQNLSELGVPCERLSEVAARVAASPYPNPRPRTAEDVTCRRSSHPLGSCVCGSTAGGRQ
jgi:hypothetical protein